MSIEDKIAMEIISPRGATLILRKQSPYPSMSDEIRTDRQVELIRAFMERERFMCDEQNLCQRIQPE